MSEFRHISADHARRFVVRRQLLDPPRALPADPESVLGVVDRVGSLQFDPIEVPGARNHDLVLHARIRDYQRAWTDGWLYGPDRRLIELYNKSLNLLPLAELPYYRLAWQRSTGHYAEFLAQHQVLADRIREHIVDTGAVSTDAFRDVDHRVQWWWNNDATTSTRAARAVLEAMFVTGEVGISRREGSRRYFDRIDRLVPAELLRTVASEERQHRHRLLSRHRGVGLMAEGGASELIHGTGSAADRKRLTAELVETGVLLPVRVEGLRETRYVLAEEAGILDETATAERKSAPAVTFVAPLDPLAWDRRLLRSLFGFDYIWEIYVPAAKRRHGYYVLPLLFGDRLVGRIEPRFERRDRTLHLLGIWFEDDFRPMEEPNFVPALAEALRAYSAFVGARRVTWPRTRLGRSLRSAVSAVS